jgi:hypothetical protein
VKKYIQVTTTDNTQVILRIDQIAGVEEIPSTHRSEGYLKLYVAGYSFSVKTENTDLQTFLKNLEEE